MQEMPIISMLAKVVDEKLVGKFIKHRATINATWLKVRRVKIYTEGDGVVLQAECVSLEGHKTSVTIYPTAEFEIADEIPEFTFNSSIARIVKRLTQYNWADADFGKFVSYWTAKLKEVKNYRDVAALMLMPLDDEALTGKMPPLIELLAAIYYSVAVTNGFMRDEDVTLDMVKNLTSEIVSDVVTAPTSEKAVIWVINKLVGE